MGDYSDEDSFIEVQLPDAVDHQGESLRAAPEEPHHLTSVKQVCALAEERLHEGIHEANTKDAKKKTTLRCD